MAIGNRVYLKKPEAAKELLEAFKEIPASNVADTMGRLCAMHPRIRLMSSPDQAVAVGRALTVKGRAGDNLMIHKALNMAKEDDVIIATNDAGESYRSLMGEIMFTVAAYKKVAGIILDGPIRDVDAVRGMKLPIYANGTNPGGPYKDGIGEINVPVSCGGISINPGDIIIMDPDGIVVVPLQDAEEVLKAAVEYHKSDAAKVTAAATGTAKREWVEKKLAAYETEIIDDYCMK
ncbi:MAG: RraA family protein [Veillonellales bacterium]